MFVVCCRFPFDDNWMQVADQLEDIAGRASDYGGTIISEDEHDQHWECSTMIEAQQLRARLAGVPNVVASWREK
jgi:hypothetical protein